MSSSSPSSPPKRPRLSLQIKALANGPSGRTSRCVAAAVDVKSPTAFNTLSNVYATAVDRSTPVQENPPTAILGRRPVLRLQTQDVAGKGRSGHTPYLGPYLDTPVTAQPLSPAVAKEICFPSAAMTATPPLSAQPQEQNGSQMLPFDAATPATAFPPGVRPPTHTQNPKRRTTTPAETANLPYTHPRSLRSILRNSPLPPLSTKSPESPRRQSLRLQEKAARRVAYNSPLTQEITTSKYTKSHIDLLAEDATPTSPCTSSEDDGDASLDQVMADADANTRDGGQTPGPFEEMRWRMANMHASTPVALSPTRGGIRKRGGKRREKKRRWVWTIGQDEEADEAEVPMTAVSAQTSRKDAAAASVPVLAVPTPRARTRQQQAQAQLAKAVAAVTQAQVPMIALPVPPVRAAAAAVAPAAANIPSAPSPPASSPPPKPQEPSQSQTRPQPLQRQARELTPIPSSLLPTRHSTPDSCASVRYLTPEPLAMSSMSLPMQHMPLRTQDSIEPPTPSVESIASVSSSLHSRDSVFETGSGVDDVEMSDATSFMMSDDEVGEKHQTSRRKRDYSNFEKESLAERRQQNEGDVEMDEGTPTMTARPVGIMEGGRGWAPWRDEGIFVDR
ncbi:hypothetical protein VTI74DRAFT_6632 [Chaetomium olivicolor]